MLELNKIHCGDTRELLNHLSPGSINCCVTSPPYWGLRDYGMDPVSFPAISFSPMPGLPEIKIPPMICKLGLEKDPWEFVGHMVLIFRGVFKALRKDGTLWLNFGDTYAAARSYQVTDNKHKDVGNKIGHSVPSGLKQKDLVGIPWRVAFALQADGWYLRQDIIWAKPNPMPESVTDRCTKSHEYIFLMSKSERYFYDHEAIKEPVAESTIGRGPVSFGGEKGRNYKPDPTDPNYRNGSEQWGRTFDYRDSCKKIKVPSGWDTSKGSESHGNFHKDGRNGSAYSFARKTNTEGKPNTPKQHREDREPIEYRYGRNKRSVWTIPTYPYKKAHFATFPPKLIAPCILAGSPKDGIVLDPFVGSGTTPFVAAENNRDWIGFDLNPSSIELTAGRIRTAEPQLF